VGEVKVTARIERGEDETDSEFALDERMGAAEVSVVVGLVLERFPDVAAGLFETDLNVVVPPVRELDLVPSWWVVKSASNPVCPTSSSIFSIVGDFVVGSSWWLIAEGTAVEGPVSLLYGDLKSSWFSAWT